MAYLSQLRATGSVEEPVEKWNRVTSCLGLSHDQQVQSTEEHFTVFMSVLCGGFWLALVRLLSHDIAQGRRSTAVQPHTHCTHDWIYDQ